MKVEQREDGITFVPESEFEINCLKQLKSKRIHKRDFEDSWNQTGKFNIEFLDIWDQGR